MTKKVTGMTEERGKYVVDGQTSEFGENINFYADWVSSSVHRTGLNVQQVTSRKGFFTLNVELAPIPSAGASPNWSEKITLQLTRKELFSTGAVLLGLLPSCIGTYHGENKNKGFSIYDNMEKGVAITLTENGKRLCHLITPDYRTELAAFVVRRIACALKISSAEALALLPMTYRTYEHLKGSHSDE